MNQKTLESLLSPSDTDRVYIPNEIFPDLIRNNKITSTSIMAFTYSYYCLVSYLYRYCKYGTDNEFTPGLIKEILGYSPNNKVVNKIIKKNGVLDEMGYTRSTRDFPLQVMMDDDRWIDFIMYSDLDSEIKCHINLAKNFKIKYPVKAFHRTIESLKENVSDGTFYEIENTHVFDVSKFIKIVSSPAGVMGFYLYQYFKHKNDLYGSYDVSFGKMIEETKMSHFALNKYIRKLEDIDCLKVSRQPFIKNLSAEERRSNTYKVV